jgi:glutamyl/glutaminyl-tRNA synthetase
LEDVVKGNIVFQNQELDDFIIQRSDGMPTYNFAVVVDDITMGINMVLRGDDHVMNTPKQILLYKALNSPLPTFGHVPMVLDMTAPGFPNVMEPCLSPHTGIWDTFPRPCLITWCV